MYLKFLSRLKSPLTIHLPFLFTNRGERTYLTQSVVGSIATPFKEKDPPKVKYLPLSYYLGLVIVKRCRLFYHPCLLLSITDDCSVSLIVCNIRRKTLYVVVVLYKDGLLDWSNISSETRNVFEREIDLTLRRPLNLTSPPDPPALSPLSPLF